MTIFDFLKNITEIKNYKLWNALLEQDKKEYNVFMINRYISMDSRFLNLVSIIDKFSFYCLDKEQHYQLLCSVIPKGNYFFKYLKKDKKEKTKQDDNIELIQLLMSNEISKEQAKKYYSLLSKKDIKLLDSYRLGGKK